MTPIRILIAEDHEVVRRGLVLVLSQEDDFLVVGEAQNGAEAVAMAKEDAPDVALLDWKMPILNGLKAAQTIKQAIPACRTLILSGAPIETAVLEALDDGVDGFIHKNVSSEGLVYAIRVVASGSPYLDPQITQMLLKQRKSAERHSAVALSPRELEILQHMATSATYKDIADQLCISETTVHTHVKRIFIKLDQPNRTQAVLSALRNGLISWGDFYN